MHNINYKYKNTWLRVVKYRTTNYVQTFIVYLSKISKSYLRIDLNLKKKLSILPIKFN